LRLIDNLDSYNLKRKKIADMSESNKEKMIKREENQDIRCLDIIYNGLRHWIGVDGTVRNYVKMYTNPYVTPRRIACSNEEEAMIRYRAFRDSLFTPVKFERKVMKVYKVKPRTLKFEKKSIRL
jgi:hypothetical protein